MPRLFVAVWPSGAVIEALRAIARPVEPDLRFTTEDQWHVTLRFLGAIAEDAVLEVVAALGAVEAAAPVEAAVGPAPRRLGPTAVVLDVEGLDGLAEAVGAAVGRFGGGDRRFHGHVTLARMRRPGRWPSGGVGGLAAPLRWTVREVALVRSHLGRGPARYETLVAVPLRGDPTP